MLLLVYHVLVLFVYLYALWFDSNFVEIPYPTKEFENVPFRARLIFLTFWTMMVQILYFIVACLNDIIGTNAVTKKPPLIRKIKDHLFSLAFTTAVYVPIAFWTLYKIDKTYIFPDEEAERQIPNWLNHLMHTSILPFILIELFVSNKNYPKRKNGLTILLCLAGAYSGYIHYLYFRYGIWPYHFLHLLSWTNKIVMTVSSALLGVLYYMVGEKINSLISKNTREQKHANGFKSH
ncbi:unnamed protein product [Chrysodeixis includens]|uniref:FAR-17a/AIG1-like protein n=1 Tax=Chrysodeixis includens TaxID=689277 RepID=A0A9P0C1A4_CHRIL|nr:unnamed protein product [Chrysodeixis includens]